MAGERKGCPEEPFAAFLEPDEALLAHARKCSRCRDRLGFVNTLRELLEEERGEVRPPEGFTERVMARVTATGQERRRVSERYGRRSGRHRRLRTVLRRYVPAFAVSAAAAVLFLVVSHYWEIRAERMCRWTLTRADKRREQRRDAYAGGARLIVVRDGVADVSGLLPDGEFYVIGQYDEAGEEICLWAYSGEQWERLREKVVRINDAALTEIWERMRAEARRLEVRHGYLSLPRPMWRRYLRGGKEVAVLSLSDRSELWERATLEEYLRPRVRVDG